VRSNLFHRRQLCSEYAFSSFNARVFAILQEPLVTASSEGIAMSPSSLFDDTEPIDEFLQSVRVGIFGKVLGGPVFNFIPVKELRDSFESRGW